MHGADDLDSLTGAVKLKQRGGHGGHNGLRSAIECLGGSQDFPRLKIGIGRPPGSMLAAAWVLQNFSGQEKEVIDVAVQESVLVVQTILSLGLEKALSGTRIGDEKRASSTRVQG